MRTLCVALRTAQLLVVAHGAIRTLSWCLPKTLVAFCVRCSLSLFLRDSGELQLPFKGALDGGKSRTVDFVSWWASFSVRLILSLLQVY